MNNTLNQAYEGMTFLYGGCCAGLLDHMICCCRRHLHRRVLRALLDALFALLLTLITAVSFFIANGGQLRLFGFVLILAGERISKWAFQPLFSML